MIITLLFFMKNSQFTDYFKKKLSYIYSHYITVMRQIR